MLKGKFITFEGPEGSGKTTHIRLLADFLREQNIEVLLTREPGGTPIGEAIRSLLQYNSAGEEPMARTEVLLFLASRAQHVDRLIRPALERGVWVLCDRFDDSTFAYQGYGRGFDVDELRLVNQFATQGLTPDLTLLLDVSPETSRMRLQARTIQASSSSDRIELESDAFHARLRRGFLELARQEPKRFVVLATEGDREPVTAAICAAVSHRLMGDGGIRAR